MLITSLLMSCSEANLTKVDDSVSPSAHGHVVCDVNEYIIPMELPEGSTNTTDTETTWRNFCPLVLQDGIYGSSGDYAQICADSLQEPVSTIISWLGTDFLADSDSTPTDLLSCGTYQTYFFEMTSYPEEMQIGANTYIGTTQAITGYTTAGSYEIPGYTDYGLNGLFPVDNCSLEASHWTADDDENTQSYSLAHACSDEDSNPFTSNEIDLQTQADPISITVNDESYTSEVSDYTLVSSESSVSSFFQGWENLVLSLCGIDALPTPLENQVIFCSVYLGPSD